MHGTPPAGSEGWLPEPHARFAWAIVENSDDAIVSKSMAGIILSWNAAAERLFQYTRDEAVGRHISLLIPQERLAEEDAIMGRLKAGERIDHFETVRLRRDGTPIPVELTISPIRDDTGLVVGASKIARDITARKAADARERHLLHHAAESNAKFRAVFDQSALFAGILEIDATILETSRVSWETFGYSKNEILGRRFWEAPWWTDAPDAAARLRVACREALAGRSSHEETSCFGADGRPHVIDLSVLPIRDETGTVVLLAYTGTDVTDRRRAEAERRESDERFRTLADNMSQLAWMADHTGWVFWYNQRWFDYTGATPDEMRQWGWTRAHHPDHVARVVDRLQRSWDSGEIWEDTFPLRGRDGTYRWFLSRAMPIRDDAGRIVRWFGTSTDITDQRQLQEALAARSEELADANRRKDEFLATLSHELRNPLGAVRTSIALMNAANATPATTARARGVLERQVGHIARLLDDLLDVSRITRDALELRLADVDLREAIAEAVHVCRPLFDAAGVSFTASLPTHPLRARADATRVHQMVCNLLTNAAKYTPAGGRTHVRVDPIARDLVVRVSDTGVGIAAEALPRVFDLFAQVGAVPRMSQSGFGIGLALVKRLATMHGGDITAESDGLGTGSTFTLRMPVLVTDTVADRASDPETAGAPGVAPAARRILVVDDDRDNADGLALFLATKGHDTAIALNGAEALAVAVTFDPDIVLLDLGLPGLDGYETCRRLRAAPGGGRRVIAALTGWGQREDRQKTRAAGFDHHFVKPVDPNELVERLAEAPDPSEAS